MSTAYPFLAETLIDTLKQDRETSAATEEQLKSFDNKVLQISSMLQTTLEVDEMMQLFAKETANIISFDSMAYKNREQLIDIHIGNNGRHSCSYKLATPKEHLGELCVSRKHRFSEEEFQLFEKLLSLLIYPLRNALLYQQALKAATKDPMTGLDNRRAMDDIISHESQMARRYDQPLSMLVVDIDHFKRINDTYGHTAGDCLIKALADILKNTARGTDYTFRYGGEEFVMLLPNTSTSGAQLVAERIRETVEETKCVCHGVTMQMTVSLGVATLNNSDTDESLFLRADAALYQAKHNGRNQHVLAE